MLLLTKAIELTLFPAVMAFAASSDLFTMTIANRVSIVLVAGFGLLAALTGMGATDLLSHVGAAAAVLTAPESIAWLLNIRGGDVPHTPLPLSFAILRADASVTLFIDRRKLAPGLDRHLGNSVAIETPELPTLP